MKKGREYTFSKAIECLTGAKKEYTEGPGIIAAITWNASDCEGKVWGWIVGDAEEVARELIEEGKKIR